MRLAHRGSGRYSVGALMAAVIKKAFKGGRTSEEAGEEEILYMCVCGFILLANTSVWLDFF